MARSRAVRGRPYVCSWRSKPSTAGDLSAMGVEGVMREFDGRFKKIGGAASNPNVVESVTLVGGRSVQIAPSPSQKRHRQHFNDLTYKPPMTFTKRSLKSAAGAVRGGIVASGTRLFWAVLDFQQRGGRFLLPVISYVDAPLAGLRRAVANPARELCPEGSRLNSARFGVRARRSSPPCRRGFQATSGDCHPAIPSRIIPLPG